MIRELSARLQKTGEQVRLKKKLERDFGTVEAELKDASARLESLSAQLEKEKVDVEKLEGTSLTALFYSVLGNREQQLEKERQELLSAQLAYQQTKHQVNSLQGEQGNLHQKLNDLADIESQYDGLLSEKERLLLDSHHAATSELFALSEQTANVNAELLETTEAIIAGTDAVAGLKQVIKSLESAENWGTWDMLGGGLLATAMKHTRIDEAKIEINEVQEKISHFKRELADIQTQVNLQLEIGGFESFADYIFDGLIFDWIVQAKIEDSLEKARTAQEAVSSIVKVLEDQGNNIKGELAELQEKRAQLLERA